MWAVPCVLGIPSASHANKTCPLAALRLRSGKPQTWAQIPALPLAARATLGQVASLPCASVFSSAKWGPVGAAGEDRGGVCGGSLANLRVWALIILVMIPAPTLTHSHLES